MYFILFFTIIVHNCNGCATWRHTIKIVPWICGHSDALSTFNQPVLHGLYTDAHHVPSHFNDSRICTNIVVIFICRGSKLSLAIKLVIGWHAAGWTQANNITATVQDFVTINLFVYTKTATHPPVYKLPTITEKSRSIFLS